MSKARLLEKLDKATDRAVSVAIECNIPLPVAPKVILVGNTVVEKNTNRLYNILYNGNLLYKDILVFDIAVIIAQRYNAGELSVVRKVLKLEEKYAKYHADMVNYLHCLKTAKKRNDSERMAILEDKFQMAELYARYIRDSITTFKRSKYPTDR